MKPALFTYDRFWAKVEKTATCWLWTACVDSGGYGLFACDKNWKAHRWLYEHFVKAVPPGLELDHLCRSRACVNPAHLELVTALENNRRGFGVCARNRRKTHCSRGHLFTSETVIAIKTGRDCRLCRRVRGSAWAKTPQGRAYRRVKYRREKERAA